MCISPFFMTGDSAVHPDGNETMIVVGLIKKLPPDIANIVLDAANLPRKLAERLPLEENYAMRTAYVISVLGILSALASCSTFSENSVAAQIKATGRETRASLQSGGDENERIAAVVTSLLEKLDEKELFSGSVLVSRAGTVVVSAGIGKANADSTNNGATIYRIGSLTKQFTATAVLQLVEQNKIRLDDPVAVYLSSAPEKWNKVTVYQLLTHTSGIHTITDPAIYGRIKGTTMTPDELIALIETLPMDFSPGKKYSYSNSGYIILGKIIENVSGSSYGTYLSEHLFKIAGMDHTGYATTNVRMVNQASGYTSTGTDEEYVDMSVPYAAGGVYSTVEDLYVWDCALASGRIVRCATVSDMMSPHAVIVPGSAFYGYGWMIGKRFGKRLITHGGEIECFTSEFSKYVDSAITIIVVANNAKTPAGLIESEIARSIFALQ
jgi:D-alanyl-D-alanine carboxypeptidase